MTPEGVVKAQIKNILHLMHVKFFVHVASALSHHGVSDIIGVLPTNGRALFIEVKAPGNKPSPAQEEFLREMSEAGACAFWADNPRTVIDYLGAIGYGPALKIVGMFPKV